ncbi:MAG: sigma-54 dependent transcriptional regulator [Bacteroidales bacterium]
MNKVLIIDDEPQLRKLLTRVIELEGYEVFQAVDCATALRQLTFCSPDVIFCDVRLPDGNGIDLIPKLKAAYPLTEIILLTAHATISDGVQAIKNGAFDYIIKGDDNSKIIPLLSRAMEKAQMGKRIKAQETQVPQQYTFQFIVGNAKVIKDAVFLAQKVAVTPVPVLLTGETGTGKEVFAQSIHQASARKEHSFVAINCASFSKELLDSEMFGYKAGSFTGALKDKKGLFEEADQGTIFLDEIGEIAVELQAKLLRILETGEYIKIGDTKLTKVNVRIIAATNRDLVHEIAKGQFREDLFYRLSVFQIHIPPLRDRVEDIAAIANVFIHSFAPQLNKEIRNVDPLFLEALKQHEWKGNVRELRNVIERSLIVCEGTELSLVDLPVEMQSKKKQLEGGIHLFDFELADMESRHIKKVLEYTKGNKTETARLLKIGLSTLYRKIDEYSITLES